MALIHRYGTTEDGVEFPVKETISKVMLCMMFDEPMDQDIYIFFSGDHLQTLALAESYFQAAKAGRYTVVFEKAEKATMVRLFLEDVSRRLKSKKTFDNGEHYMKITLKKETNDQVATLYMHGFSDNKVVIPLHTEISKQLLCSMFDQQVTQRIEVYFQGELLTLFGVDDLDMSFITEKPGFFRIRFGSCDTIAVDSANTDNWPSVGQWSNNQQQQWPNPPQWQPNQQWNTDPWPTKSVENKRERTAAGRSNSPPSPLKWGETKDLNAGWSKPARWNPSSPTSSPPFSGDWMGKPRTVEIGTGSSSSSSNQQACEINFWGGNTENNTWNGEDKAKTVEADEEFLYQEDQAPLNDFSTWKETKEKEKTVKVEQEENVEEIGEDAEEEDELFEEEAEMEEEEEEEDGEEYILEEEETPTSLVHFNPEANDWEVVEFVDESDA